MTNFELIKSHVTTIKSATNIVIRLGQEQFKKDAEGEQWSIPDGDMRVKLWTKACNQMQELNKIAGELVATMSVIEEVSNATKR